MNIWIILGLVMIASLLIQRTLTSRFEKYSQVSLRSGLSGADVARKMLRDNGIYDVDVRCVEGTLTDHYHPGEKVVNLSEAVFNGRSVAAAAVAAHECGHALQHASRYPALQMRSALVPVVNFSNKFVSLALILGVLLIDSMPVILNVGIALFAVSTLFSFITLPVEINASNRAVNWLRDTHLTDSVTTPMAVDALKWAAYTYVIAAIGSLATLLYYIGLANGRRN